MLGNKYYPSVAVFLSEFVKFLICFIIFVFQLTKENPNASLSDRVSIGTEILFGSKSQIWKLAIPAGLYTIQNNLQYFSVAVLDAAT